VTVAAVILAASPESALADADGAPRVRRLADSAWAGGAFPIVVVAPDPNGTVAPALAGASVTLAEPAPLEGGPAAQIVRGVEVAIAEVTGTDAAIIWPARMAWVDPETITSLIEAHGVDPDPILVPTYRGEAGWPALIPVVHLDRLRAVAPSLVPDEILDLLRRAGVTIRDLDLGDPGSVHDGETGRSELPHFEGPPEPTAGHAHEWGAEVAERPDDGPLEGPSIARYAGPGDSSSGR
jgi:CTP:molybdopterin cytidylyltransferase MocA